MKKKILITGLFVVYVLLLFAVAKHYENVDNSYAPELSNIGKGIRHLFLYILIASISSLSFSLIVVMVYRKATIQAILQIIFGFLLSVAVVALFSNFVFWITQLEDDVNLFMKLFLVAVASTLLNAVWHMSKSGT